MINDTFAQVNFNSSTDATGGIPTQLVTGFTINGTTNTSRLFLNDSFVDADKTNHNFTCFSPYNISVNYTGYNDRNVRTNMNHSLFLNLSMSITDTTKPRINASI